jgi:hypothetical protein
MNPAKQSRLLVVQAAAFVSAVYAYVITRLRMARSSQPRISTSLSFVCSWSLQHLVPLILCRTLLTGAWKHLAPMILCRTVFTGASNTWLL